MRLRAGKFTHAAIACAALVTCAVTVLPAYAAEPGGEHASRLSQLVDRLQTGSVSPSGKSSAVADVQDSCAVPATADDADLKRNSGDLKGLCVETVRFSEHDVTWTLQRISSGRPGPLWTIFHDDGDAAFSAALYGLKKYGGTLMAVEAGEHALHAGLDPENLFAGDRAHKGAIRTWPRYASLFIYEALNASAIVSVKTSAVLAPGKSGRLVLAGVGSNIVGQVRGNNPASMPDVELSWLDADNIEAVSAFAGRLFSLGTLPYFRIEASGELPGPCEAVIDRIASAVQMPEIASSNDHYSPQGKLNTN